MTDELPVDVFRKIVSFSASSRAILDLYSLNDSAKDAVSREIRKMSKKSPIRVDVARFFRETNPFMSEFYELGNKIHRKELHERIRELARLLERLLDVGDGFQIENLSASALGFEVEEDEQYMDRAPFMLQKKMVHILQQFKGKEIWVSPVFMRPSRVIRTFRNRFDTITSLDLGNMKALASTKLRSYVFPALENLEKLTWHHANIRFLSKIPNKERLKSLELTCHVIGRPTWREFEVLAEFSGLENAYFGFTVPHKPSRMEMDILLNLHQAIWSKKFGEQKQILLKNYPEIRKLGFWNAPEKIFQQLSRNGVELDTLNFGQISQNLSRLCSFDSILQSFFKFEELDDAIPAPKIRNLNMNLHAMPAVDLEYYMPNTMDRVNKLASLESISLFVKCMFQSQMTSSWSLESKKEKASRRRPVFDANYTKFSLHCEGLCGLEDLDRQLPPSLESCSISLNLPSEFAPKVLGSVLEFVRKLGSINDFPELEHFHIQIHGVKCLELLTHTIAESLGAHLKSVSILAPARNVEKEAAKRLLVEMADLFPKCTRIALSPDFFRPLLSESRQKSPQWPEKVQKLARKSGFAVERCTLTAVASILTGFVCKPDEPAEFEDFLEHKSSDNKPEILDDFAEEFDDVEDEEDLEDTQIVYEESEDELEVLERKLEKETERRHKKWQKSRKIEVSDDEDEVEGEEEEDDEDVVDWNALDEQEDEEDEPQQNGFIDNEAIETDDDDSGGDEEEPEGEDLDDSDDERLFLNGPSRKRKSDEKERNAKRRRIVLSDDDEDD